MTNEDENINECFDFCIRCKCDVWLNAFTGRWESDDFDFPSVCPQEDGAIRERSHAPKRTTSIDQLEPIVHNGIPAWGWVPPPRSAPTESEGRVQSSTPSRGVGGCSSYSAYYNQRPEVEPDVPEEHLGMPLL